MTTVTDYTALLSGYTWNARTVGHAATVTYSFDEVAASTVTSAQAATFVPLSQADRAVVRQAIAQWQAASGVTFHETSQHVGDIRFGTYDLATFGQAGAAGLGAYPTDFAYDQQGVVYASSSDAQFGGDIEFYKAAPVSLHLALHEIGHALGLKHPFEGDPTLSPALDTGGNTVMAYNPPYSDRLGPLDIAAIQYLYGLNGTADTLSVTWDPATESVVETGTAAAEYIRGTNGNDRIDGGGGRDAIMAGAGDDVILVGSGSVSVNAGPGVDTVITGLAYVGASSVSDQASGITVFAPGVSQTFYGTEFIQFGNGTYSAATKSFTPVVLAYTFAAAAGSLSAAANWRVDATGALSGSVPGAFDSVTFRTTGVLTGTATFGAVTLAGQATLSGTLRAQTLQAGAGTLDTRGGGTFGVSGNATLAGGALIAESNSVIAVGSTGYSPNSPGYVIVDAGAVLSGWGTITAASLFNNGTVGASGGTLRVTGASVGGTGAWTVGAGATLWAPITTGTVTFAGANATLRSDVFSGSFSLAGFDPGDRLLLPGVSGVSVSGGMLTLVSGRSSVAVRLVGDYSQSAFRLDGSGAVVVDSLSTNPLFDPLFDRAYYLAQNPDVAAAGVDPYRHYMVSGWREGRNPDAFFDTRYYLALNADVRAADVNPLAHFESSGWREGRQPGLAFSDSAYLAANADVLAAGINPLQHYLQSGRTEGRAAPVNGPIKDGSRGTILVDESFAIGQVASIRPPTLDVAKWFHQTGWTLGVNPDPWFDTGYYLARNPDVRAAGIDPLAHFEASGWREGREPSLLFSDARYLDAYPDVKAAGIDPLLHYVGNGRAEGRMAFLGGGSAAADPLVDAAYYDRQLGATLIPGGVGGAQQAAWSYDATGWRQGLNPDAFFDTGYYLSRNPDVAAAGVNPLVHYEVNGWREGRDASASFSTGKYLAAYGDVRAAGVNPLLHYVVNGQAEGRSAFGV